METVTTRKNQVHSAAPSPQGVTLHVRFNRVLYQMLFPTGNKPATFGLASVQEVTSNRKQGYAIENTK